MSFFADLERRQGEANLQAMRDQQLNKYLSDGEIIGDLSQTCHEQQTKLAEKDAEIEKYKEAICIFVREKWGDMDIETDEEAVKTFFKYFNKEAF